MPTSPPRTLTCLCLLALLPCHLGRAGDTFAPALERSVIASGGGVSSGSGYRVTGTVGQAAVGEAGDDDRYRLRGGFWTTAAPTPPPVDELFADGFEALTRQNHLETDDASMP